MTAQDPRFQGRERLRQGSRVEKSKKEFRVFPSLEKETLNLTAVNIGKDSKTPSEQSIYAGSLCFTHLSLFSGCLAIGWLAPHACCRN